MMILTKEATKLMENQLIDNPLADGEIRRVEGMGGLYITSQRLEQSLDQEEEVVKGGMEYWFQYALKLNGTTYYLYGGEPAFRASSK